MLHNCLHNFCKNCLVQTIMHSEETEIKCPYIDGKGCPETLLDREIRELLTKQQHEKYLKRVISHAENSLGNTFHCKKPDCAGFCICEDDVNEFRCPACLSVNCISCGVCNRFLNYLETITYFLFICQAIHKGKNCKEYQDGLKGNADETSSLNALKEMVKSGNAMHCPRCNVSIVCFIQEYLNHQTTYSTCACEWVWSFKVEKL